ncbi:MAG: class I SAM-dependent methyltransferase [Desulfobulbaceae bacterium]|nr:class I SAM-dependent methyltransferase [Desulfobulbaceae bacterium]
MNNLAEIFVDIEKHKNAGRFISSCSINRQDIREFTFAGEDLTACRSILDLGCAFGYFTSGLKGRVHPEATIVGIDLWEGCEDYYVNACLNAGIAAQFCLSKRPFCALCPANRYDLALCSFALYFFPDALPEIVQLLKEKGIFITIAHSRPHMQELVQLVKDLLVEDGYNRPEALPLESLIAKFSAGNGMELLSPWFEEIKVKEYGNALRIDTETLPHLMKYLRFKRPLFLPEELHVEEDFMERVEARIRQEIAAKGSFMISKDDVVFVCNGPKTR